MLNVECSLLPRLPELYGFISPFPLLSPVKFSLQKQTEETKKKHRSVNRKERKGRKESGFKS